MMPLLLPSHGILAGSLSGGVERMLHDELSQVQFLNHATERIDDEAGRIILTTVLLGHDASCCGSHEPKK